MITLTITRDTATRDIGELQARLAPRALNAELGQAVRVSIREHLRLKNLQPNKQGWPKTGFYGRARERVVWEADGRRALVRIQMDGIRQRYKGGEIKPVNASVLTIPAIAEAYGRTAQEFPGLMARFFGRRGGKLAGALVRTVPGGGDEVVYWLLRRVEQQPDPSVLPTAAEFARDIQKAVVRRLRRMGLR